MSTDIVPARHDETLPALPLPDPFASKRQVRSFFDQDTPARIAQLGRAMHLDDTSFPNDPTPVECVGITLWTRRVSKHDEAEKWGVYTAFHCKDGSNFVTASDVVRDSCLHDLAASYGMPPWPKGVTITLGRARKGNATIGRCYAAPGDLSVAPSL